MNFLTQLGVLAIILIILIILIKSNRTLEQIYMEGEQEAKTIEIPSFKMPKIRFSKEKREKKVPDWPDDEEKEKDISIERSLATVPREMSSGWYIETIDVMGRSYGRKSITSFPFTIGRNSDNDYVLDDLSVSGHHASLDCKDGTMRLVDEGSLNKILTGSREVTEIPVTDRLEVALGNTRIRFGKAGTRAEHTTSYKQSSWMEEWY